MVLFLFYLKGYCMIEFNSIDKKICPWTGQLTWNHTFPFWSNLESYVNWCQTWIKIIKGFAKTDIVIYLSSCQTWIKSIEGFAKTDIVKTLTQNLYIKILSLWPWPWCSVLEWGWYHVNISTIYHYAKLNQIHQRLCKNLNAKLKE